ncbi:MAG: pantetheine-phosphate adenylyltransferase [Clostridia bacterium]|nr:pantetheine-phosphate adenylyltransferase [Clostridia bacterium]
MKKCVFAGSFDPPTTGHKKIIDDCLKIFDSVTVAVMVNPKKVCLLEEEERASLLKKLYADNMSVKVITFQGAAADLLESENTPFYVRGIRDGTDLDYENRDRLATQKFNSDVVTVYLPADRENLEVSSSLVKNCIKFKKDFSDYIPKEILDDFKTLLESKNV